MNHDLKEMDFDFLKEVRMVQFTNLITLQLTKDPNDASKITALEQYVKKLDGEIKRRNEEGEKVDKKENVKTESVANFMSHKIKGMSNTIATEVPVFSTSHDVHIWLNKLESYWKLYVANDTSGLMEEHFIQCAKSRVCSEYLHAMLSSSDATNTFEELKTYMKKNHASKMSVFQILDTIWEMDQKETENFRDFGIRLDDKAKEAENIIEAKFKEWADANEGSEMNKSDIYKLVSGQVFLQSLKNKHRVVYNNICNDLDKTWSANEIALKAMTFSDRMASSDDSQNQGSVPDAFAAQHGRNSNSNSNKGSRNQNNSRHENGKKNGNCWFFTSTGKCSRDKCNFNHSQEERKMFKELRGRENKNGNNKGNDAKPQGGNDKNAKSGYKGNTQPVSYAAAVDGTPVVPLPTQNFRD